MPKSSLHFAARWGRWLVAMDHRAGLERADDLLHLAQELGDPAHLVQAHHCQWATLYMLGAHEECCRHADEGIRLYDPDRHRLQAHLYGGHDPKVCALGERALSCWLLGASTRASPTSVSRWTGPTRWRMWAAVFTPWTTRSSLHRLRQDAAEVARRANQMVAFAAEQHLSEHRAKGMLFRGWATALLGDVSVVSADARCAGAEEEAGTPEDFPLYYEMFAEVCELAGRFDEGLDAISKASRRPSAVASSTGTRSSIAAEASSCSPRATTPWPWPAASSRP